MLHAGSSARSVKITGYSRENDSLWLNTKTKVAQLVEHRVVMREVVSSTPAGRTLRVLK